MTDSIDSHELSKPLYEGRPMADEQLQKQVELSQRAMTTLVSHAIKEGVDPSRFDHMSEVFDPRFYTIGGKKFMKSEVAGDTDYWGRPRIREDSVNFTTILHESIHRAANLRNLKEDDMTGTEKLIDLYKDGETSLSDSEAVYMNDILQEGLTYWVQELTNRIRDPNEQAPRVDRIPGRLLQYFLAVDLIARELLGRGLSLSKVDAIMIQVALTRDYGELISRVGPSQLREILAPYIKALSSHEDSIGPIR